MKAVFGGFQNVDSFCRFVVFGAKSGAWFLSGSKFFVYSGMNTDNCRNTTPPKGRDESENRLQQKCFKWFTQNYPELHGLLWHNYNNPRNKVAGAQLKTMGLIAGIPDLIFVGGGVPVFFELKTKTGRVSEAQKGIHKQLNAHNMDVHIIRDIEEFKTAFFESLERVGLGQRACVWGVASCNNPLTQYEAEN